MKKLILALLIPLHAQALDTNDVQALTNLLNASIIIAPLVCGSICATLGWYIILKPEILKAKSALIKAETKYLEVQNNLEIAQLRELLKDTESQIEELKKQLNQVSKVS